MEKRDRPFFRKRHRIITLMLVMLASYTNVSAGIALKVNNLLIFAYPEEGYATVSPYKWLSWLESWVDHKDYNQFEDLVIPDSVTWEEHWGEVTKIYTLPVTAIGDNAFEKCDKVKHITLPKTIKTIGRRAFYGCTNLEEIMLPDKLEAICDSAFIGCTGISSFRIGPAVNSIGNRVFDTDFITSMTVSFDNKTFDSRDGGNLIVHTASNTLVWCSPEREIPKSIEAISDYAFAYCRKLRSIYIPDNVKRIGVGSFRCCSKLSNVRLPEGLERIEELTFSSCSFSSIELPKSLTYIGEKAFLSNYLRDISIPDNVSYIGDGCFLLSWYIEKIHLSKVRHIGNRAFSHCPNLREVRLPDGLEFIGEDVFYDGPPSVKTPSNIIKVIMPSTRCDFEALTPFNNCQYLHYVIRDVEHPIYPLTYSTFLDKSVLPEHEHCIYDNATLFVPLNSIEEYKNLDGWKEFGRILPLEYIDGIDQPEKDAEQVKVNCMCDLQGRIISSPRKGLNIIRYSDGTVKKEWK